MVTSASYSFLDTFSKSSLSACSPSELSPSACRSRPSLTPQPSKCRAEASTRPRSELRNRSRTLSIGLRCERTYLPCSKLPWTTSCFHGHVDRLLYQASLPPRFSATQHNNLREHCQGKRLTFTFARNLGRLPTWALPPLACHSMRSFGQFSNTLAQGRGPTPNSSALLFAPPGAIRPRIPPCCHLNVSFLLHHLHGYWEVVRYTDFHFVEVLDLAIHTCRPDDVVSPVSLHVGARVPSQRPFSPSSPEHVDDNGDMLMGSASVSS